MSVTVRTTPQNSITVTQGSQTAGGVTIKKSGDLTLQGLSNVNSTNLDDGYTIIYDTQTRKWVTQPVSNVTITAVDGGTY